MVFAFLGAFLSSRDSIHHQQVGADESIDEEQEAANGLSALFGIALALGSSFGGVAYLLAARKCRPRMNLFVFLFCIMVLTALTTLCSIYATGSKVTWDRDMYHGVFGWTNFVKNRLPLEVVMVLSCNFVGSMGMSCGCSRNFPLVILLTRSSTQASYEA